jgi:DNA-binding transcriptional LysR family regulator
LVNIEKEIQSAIGNLDHKYGNFTIKTPQSISTYFFPDLIKEFQLIFPKIGFDIDWCTSFNLVDLFNSGTIDLAFLISDKFKDKNLQVEELTKIKLVLAVHLQNELLEKKNVTIKDLNNKTLVFAKSDCNYKNILDKMLIQSEAKPDKIIEINSMDAIKKLLVLGSGIAFLPEMAITEELNNGSLKTLNWSGPNFGAKLIMILSKEKHISKPLNAFMIIVRKMMQNYPV